MTLSELKVILASSAICDKAVMTIMESREHVGYIAGLIFV
jgi:hypothetical protein